MRKLIITSKILSQVGMCKKLNRVREVLKDNIPRDIMAVLAYP